MPRTKPLGEKDLDNLPSVSAGDEPWDDAFLTTREAARLVKLSVKWFERRRYEGFGGPPFHRRGRAVRYLRSELIAWFQEGRVNPQGRPT